MSVEKAFFEKGCKDKFFPCTKIGNEPGCHVIQSEFDAEKRAGVLKRLASDLGFSSCRIAKAGFLEEEAPKLESWLSHSHHGEMAYMENHFDKRLDPRLLVDNCRSVVTLAFSYFPEKKLFSEGELKVSTYAYGSDYHKVLKKKLKQLLKDFQAATGEVAGRVFVDSAPVLEKAWAARNGTGWLAKHTNIIHPKHGSFFFLCEINYFSNRFSILKVLLKNIDEIQFFLYNVSIYNIIHKFENMLRISLLITNQSFKNLNGFNIIKYSLNINHRQAILITHFQFSIKRQSFHL